MPDISAMQRLHNDMRLWRQHIHRHPEMAYEEFNTAAFINDRLREFGLQPLQDIGGTGVVASLSKGNGEKKIALRADMDALLIQELNNFAYKSSVDGVMHACGHDGHCAMLLGAASYLSKHGNFNGTVHFIFQPAEEGRAGAKSMIDDGLFARFPTQQVYGMHNFPEVPVGHFAIKPGAMMAAFDCFEIQIKGVASHAAMPHLGKDPIIAAAQLINAIQTLVSRTIDPGESAVVSVTQVHAGNTWNAIPESVMMRGTIRCFNPGLQQHLRQQLQQLVQSVPTACGITGSIVYNPENPGYPVTMNTAAETQRAIKAATDLVGSHCVDLNPTPSMGSEDFAYMLQERPGCYVWIGNGDAGGGCLLHNPNYDFNDEILPLGAGYWVKLVENELQ